MKVAWAALSALSVGACSLIYTGDGLVGPGPDAGANDANAEGASDASIDALDDKAPVVIDGQDGIGGIAIDPTYLYWTTSNGKVTRRKRDGAATDEEIASGEVSPGAIAIDTTHVYWTAKLAVRRRLLTGGPIEPFVTTPEDPSGLAVDPAKNGTIVYWTERAGGVLKSKGLNEVVAASNIDQPSAVAISSQRVYVVIANGQLHSLNAFGAGTINPQAEVSGKRISAVTGVSPVVYFAGGSNSTFARYDPSAVGSKETNLLSDVTSPAIACDGGFLYFVDAEKRRIRRFTLP